MKLPIPSFLEKKPKAEYFLSLLLRDEKANAVIIEESEGKIKIIGKHEEHFTTTVEQVTDEELLHVLDKIISKAEETLPANIETQKTVFGVKGDWVDEKKIKKEYLIRLKKVCDTLHLTPIGFLVISEAIAHLIQEEEGAPLSAMLCEVSKHFVTLTLFRAGKIIETKNATIEESVPKTVDNLLKHIESVEVLPSRIIIFDGRRSEDLAQTFITHQWSKSLPFLHMPQISVLPYGFEAKAVVFGAALQMGFEITGAIVDKTGKEIKTFASGDGHPESPEPVTSDEIPVAPIDTAPALSLDTPITEAEIVSDESDVPETDKEIVSEEKHTISIDDVPADNFGFIMDQDIATIAATHVEHPTPAQSTENEMHQTASDNNFVDESEQSNSSAKRSLSSMIPFAKLSGVFSGLKEKLPKLRIPFPSGGNKRLLIIPLVLVILIGILAGLYVSSLKASVTLHIKTKGLQEKPTITFSLSSPSDFAGNTISAHTISTSIDGTASTAVTGKKQVGEKAKGTVTIYNNADAKKSLTQGQTITSSNGIDFLLDKDISVASASGDAFSGTKPSTTQVTVTAKDIGSESNLPSNTKFTIANSTLAAKNDSAFSGGSKKDISVVAKADVEKLLTDVQKNVEENAKDELQKKVSSDEVLLPLQLKATIDKKTFDKNVGDETKNLTLKATVQFSSASYKKSDLTEFAQVFLKNKFSEDLTISEKGIETSVSDIKQANNDTITASVAIAASLLPKLDTSAMQKKITGKSFTLADEELRKTPQVESIDIILKPNLPFLPKLLPQQTKNISVSIATNE